MFGGREGKGRRREISSRLSRSLKFVCGGFTPPSQIVDSSHPIKARHTPLVSLLPYAQHHSLTLTRSRAVIHTVPDPIHNSQPLSVAEMSTGMSTEMSTEKEKLFEELDVYDWDTDSEFQVRLALP